MRKYFIPIIFALTIATLVPFANVYAEKIFDNGLPDFTNSWRLESTVRAEDFILSSDMVLTDVHVFTRETQGLFDDNIQWWIFEDNSGVPGLIVANGTGININRNMTSPPGPIETWETDFDLDNPVALQGGTTYWIGLHFTDTFGLNASSILWIETSPGFGSSSYYDFNTGDVTSWTISTPDDGEGHLAFFLTGHPSQQIAGELLPLDSTALFLAGFSSVAIWMIPVITTAGAGLYLVGNSYNRRNLKVLFGYYFDKIKKTD